MKKVNRSALKMSVAAVVMILLSAVMLGARYMLEKQDEGKDTEQIPQVVAEVNNENGSYTIKDTAAGTTIKDKCSVKVTDGEGYVRFNLELIDSDGESFNSKLSALRTDIDYYEGALDEASPSYQAFLDTYYKLQNEYNLLYSKAQLALQTFCCAQGSSTIYTTKSYNQSELDSLVQNGDLAFISDYGDGENDIFTQIFDSEYPFTRSFYGANKLTAGDSITLFTNIIIPTDWSSEMSQVTYYLSDDEGNYSEADTFFLNEDIIYDGFSVRVTADIVDAKDFDNPLAAFASVDNVSAVTELDSSAYSSY